jgi:deoxyribodipyrimidine photo-lyase
VAPTDGKLLWLVDAQAAQHETAGMKTALWWIRRDLRLADNPTLSTALARAERVLPVFVLDPAVWPLPEVGEKRRLLLGGLQELETALRERGCYLVVREGEPLSALSALVRESGAEMIFAEADGTPYGRARDAQVAASLPLSLLEVAGIRAPGTVLRKDGGLYTVYTPFKHAWRGLPLPLREELLPAPERISTPAGIASTPLPVPPTLPGAVLFPPGEVEARRRLEAFVAKGIARYAETRDRMDLSGTSELSPYLCFGMLSARQAAVAALEAREGPDAREGAQVWLGELIWREFYLHILYHFPNVLRESFREPLREIPWDNDTRAFAAWQEGLTGYPVVDAAMRQLRAMGWMHNRARMIVASFLTKDLLIDWRWGERYFMQQLMDGDLASNNGGWQWAAGTGTDAAPYFRIFNPVLQGEKFDPEGAYVHRWVGELAQCLIAIFSVPGPCRRSDPAQAAVFWERITPLPLWIMPGPASARWQPIGRLRRGKKRRNLHTKMSEAEHEFVVSAVPRLVLHGTWTDGHFFIWAESAEFTVSSRGRRPKLAPNPYTAPPEVLRDALTRLYPDGVWDAMPEASHGIFLPSSETFPLLPPWLRPEAVSADPGKAAMTEEAVVLAPGRSKDWHWMCLQL